MHALPDPHLSACVVRRVPLRYRDGADPRADRPPHVRAASGLAWVGARLAVVQDDANFVALVDPATGLADCVTLPRGSGGHRQFDDGRGNKADKLDLEALTSVPGPDGPLLVAIGSGSTSRRERIMTVAGLDGDPDVRSHHVPRFFAALRALAQFAGSELNVEGAVYLDGRLRLFGRGNGAARDGAQPVNATCDVDWAGLYAHLQRPDDVAPPPLAGVAQYALGELAGVRLTFTDAALAEPGEGARRRVIYTAAAEASPDATRDGEVAGSAIGVLYEGAAGRIARWTALVDADGRALAEKVEGIALVPGDGRRAFIAVDHDDHERPSELCEVKLEGPWT